MSETTPPLPELPFMLRLRLFILKGSLDMLEKQLRDFPPNFVETQLLADVLLDAVPVADGIAKWRANTEAFWLGTKDAPGAESGRPRTIDHRKKEEAPDVAPDPKPAA